MAPLLIIFITLLLIIGAWALLNFSEGITARRKWENEALRTTNGSPWASAEETEYGIFLRTSPEKRTDTVVVFIHGILGDSGTWQQLPNLLRNSLLTTDAFEFDAYLFDYPAKLVEKASIPGTADDLRIALESHLKPYHHIFFVAHSAGGLAVKMVMIEEMKKALEFFEANRGERFNPEVSSQIRELPAFKFRNVVNFAVPHSGGAPFISTSLIIIYFLLLPWWGVLMIFCLVAGRIPVIGANLRLRRKYNFGINKIVFQLRRHHPDLLKLERDYCDLRLKFDRMRFSRAIASEVGGKDDLTIDRSKSRSDDLLRRENEGPRQTDKNIFMLMLRASHTAVKEARHPSDPAVESISQHLRRTIPPIEAQICCDTYFRSLAIDWDDTLLGSDDLVRPEEIEWNGAQERDGAARTAKPATVDEPPRQHIDGLSQHRSLLRLHSVVWRTAQVKSATVISGQEGVGKSFVLRAFARSLVLRRLNFKKQGGLPLLLALQQLAVPEKEVNAHMEVNQCGRIASLWRVLLEKFVITANRYSPIGGYVASYFDQACKRGDLILILDSVDEFLINHPWLTEWEIVLLLRHLKDIYGPEFPVIFGVRDSHPLHKLLSDYTRREIIVGPVDDEDAGKRFPELTRILTHFKEKGSQIPDFLLTPQILVALRDAPLDEIDLRHLENKATTVNLALHSILQNSGLLVVEESEDFSLCLGELELSLAVIAIAHAASGKGTIRQADILETLNSPAFQLEKLRECVRGTASWLEDPKFFKNVMHRTVFVPVGGESYRFRHRQWQDYLAGFYFYDCVRSMDLLDLSRSAFTLSAFAYGGALLEEDARFTLDQEFIEQAKPWFDSPRGQLTIGNLGGLLGNSEITLTPEAGQLLGEYLSDPKRERKTGLINPGSPCCRAGDMVLLGGIGYRLLAAKNSGEEPNAVLMQLVQIISKASLARIQSSEDSTGMDHVMASLAWCLQRRLGDKSFEKIEWPGLDLDKQREDQVIHLQFADLTNLPPAPHFLSIQRAHLSNQYSVLEDQSARPPSIVHYLFCLSLAAKHGVVSFSTLESLLNLTTSEVRNVYAAYPLPQVTKIFHSATANIHLAKTRSADFR